MKLYHSLRFWWLRRLVAWTWLPLTAGYAIYLLERNTTDYTIDNHDWMTHGYINGRRMWYRVTVCTFWARGTGIGESLLQATRRALRQMRRQREAFVREQRRHIKEEIFL